MPLQVLREASVGIVQRWMRSVPTIGFAAGGLLFGQTSPSLANECVPNMVRVNICQVAVNIQLRESRTVPAYLGDGMVLTSVVASGATVRFVITTEESLEEHKSDLRRLRYSEKYFNDQMDKIVRASYCGVDTDAAFVRLGGKFEFALKTFDGTLIHESTVSTCPRKSPKR